jgi:hypothetical protein
MKEKKVHCCHGPLAEGIFEPSVTLDIDDKMLHTVETKAIILVEI